MLVYPQLATGALCQLPVRKTRRKRTIVNLLGDRSAIKLADAPAETIEWRLDYQGLSDEEAGSLENFFMAAEGSLNAFTFADPAANLLAWSEQLDDAVWLKGLYLSTEAGVADPNGGARAWRISNSGAAPQRISQTLSMPGRYVYCLSAYAKASQPTVATLLLGASRVDRALTSDWQRIIASGRGDAASEFVEFGLELPAGASLDLFGMQVEPQPAASAYKASAAGGVYQNARFQNDALWFTATDLHRTSVTVNIIHANRL